MPYLQNIEFYILNDGNCWVDGGGTFGLVPRVIWQQLLPPDENNRIPFVLNSLFVRSEGKNILVDTGYGNKLSQKAREHVGLERPQGDIVTQLAGLGVQPEDIDIVINTHLHLDHCGGNTTFKRDESSGGPVPTYPNAQYHIQRLEWADAIAPNERTRATYLPENYLPLQQSGQLKLINGNTHITGEVRTAVTRGHTRAHQVVILESNGETALFIADLSTLHYHIQRLAWVTSYDVEPLESIETKRYWQQWAVNHNALIIFQHDTQITAGKLTRNGKRFKIEPASLG